VKVALLHSNILMVALSAMCVVTCAYGAHAVIPQSIPQDAPYPGALTINIDLSDASKRIYSVHETIPVKAGPFTLYYPQWILPDHAPDGPIANIAGLIITADGKRVAWRRDLRDMYTLHMNVPIGARKLDVSFQYLSPGHGALFGIDVWATPYLADVDFTEVSFYPAGYYVRDIQIQPTVVLPFDWKFGTAMAVADQSGDVVHFKPVSFNNFIDSPLIAGRYFNRVDLAPGAKAPVHLNIVGDTAADVHINDRQFTEFRSLVRQIYALFGSRHFDRYDLLLTLSDHIPHDGLEHHKSSDSRLPADFLSDSDIFILAASVMPHEFIHSWNGKFRRPVDLWTPNFNMPERNDMEWVYEGLTEYWAGVITTRSGMWTATQYLDQIASVAASMSHRTGRTWRSLQDVADAAQLLYTNGDEWTNYRRGTDFYPEGQLLWLDVDTKIRALSDNKHSLDDFAHKFYGMDNGSYVTKTYNFEDVVNTLNQVQPFDWAKFLRSRLDYTGPNLPEHGVDRGGWKLVYTNEPNAADKAKEKGMDITDLAYSIGLTASKRGEVYDVQWGGPAFRAGLVPGMTIVGVDGVGYSSDVIKDSITAASKSKAPIELLIKNTNVYSTLKVDYYGGLKYPHLARERGTADLVSDIVAPRK